MGTAIYSMKFPSNANLFPVWKGEHWLGKTVTFKLNGIEFEGEVVATHREYNVCGIHDILTVELSNETKEVKIEGHRQMFRIKQ